MRLSTRLGLPSALLVVAVLCGCTDGAEVSPNNDEQSIPEPPIGEIRVVTEPAAATRPIDEYLLDTQGVLELVQSHTLQVARCLKDGGYSETFEYPSQDEVVGFVATVVDDRRLRSLLWGFFDVENARTLGYQRETASGALTVPALGKEASAECMNLEGFDPIKFAFDKSLPDAGPPVPVEDSRVRAAITAWAQCMSDHGFNYTDPLEPLNEFQSESPASSRQIATATADVDCKIDTNLVGIAVTVEDAYDQVYIEQHSAELEEYRTRIDDFLRAGAALE
jgi:hypothetical protein